MALALALARNHLLFAVNNEIAGVWRRRHCPLSRTIFLGKPTDTFLDAEKAGYRCADIANAFFGVSEKHSIEKDNRAGYRIMLSYSPDWGEGSMSIGNSEETVLEAGMMTGFGLEDFGFEITESIVIGESGPEVLANIRLKLAVKP